jgi:uncharacterized protein YbaP (TraB family)
MMREMMREMMRDLQHLYLYFFSFLCLCTPFLLAQPSPTPDSTRIDALLWQISGNGLKQPSYLFGTIHLICKEDVVMPRATKRCFAASRQLALEFDISKAGEQAMMAAMDKGVLMRDGTTLRDLIDSADFALLDRYFLDSAGMSLKMMERFKPMFLSMFLMESGSECEETSYEEEFSRIAKQQKKPIVGVETMQQQLELFDRIPYKEQATMLVEEIKSIVQPSANKPAATVDLASITTLYKQGRISELLDAMREESIKGASGGGTSFEEILLNERNRAWIPILDKMMRSKATFVAVGAGHLAGTQGVVSLLRKQGFVLTPLR